MRDEALSLSKVENSSRPLFAVFDHLEAEKDFSTVLNVYSVRQLICMLKESDSGTDCVLTEDACNIKVNRPFSFIFILLILTDLSIILDITPLRLVLGFAFLTFIPGLLILYILKLKKLDLVEMAALSVGLSVSFLMFAGFLINSLYPLFGYDTPLSTSSLVLSFSVIILILAFIASLSYHIPLLAELSIPKLEPREKAFLLIPAFFPSLSILGMHLMNVAGNNTILMALLLLIPAHAVFIALKRNQVPERIYPLMIFLISTSLVLMRSLRSNHIIGIDVHSEYYLFQQTFHNGLWQILMKNPLDSCLSISILPTAYQSFLNIDPEYIFKIVYPLLFSFVPLIVYIISKKYISSFYAFLASLFFMSQSTFLWAGGNPRTTVAINFFSLSIMVLFLRGPEKSAKLLLFIIFAISCIVSHYATTYIFFFILFLTWLSMHILNRIFSSKRRPALNNNPLSCPESQAAGLKNPQSSRELTVTYGIVILFFMVLFLWYSQVTETAFGSGVYFITTTIRSLQDFFILESRGENIVEAFGGGLGFKSFPQKVTFVSSWLSIAFIAFGILTTLIRHRNEVALPSEDEVHMPCFLSQKLDAEFFIFALVCSTILMVAVALPFLAKGYGIDRAYSQMMIVLSPFFIIGGIKVARTLRMRQRYLVVLAVLIPIIMCNTGIMNQLFGNFQEIALNSKGPIYDLMFVHDQEGCCAKWIKYNVDAGAKIYADYFGRFSLMSQGMIRSSIYNPSFIEDTTTIGNGYIFLRYINVIDKKLLQGDSKWNNLAEYDHLFFDKDEIYNNGGSQVWR